MTKQLNYHKLPPFKAFVVDNFPFIEATFDATDNYQLLCKIVAYIDVVAKNNNELTDDMRSLYNEFIALKSYIDNYFENLDVQEEINNKLDDMAEHGELTEIIAEYLGLAGMITFNTVAEMKSAENLINGSKCATLGYSSVNDGGNSFYKVRTVTNEDIVDEMFIIALNDNSLVAELIIDSTINIKQLGANENDENNSTYINASLDKLGYAYIPTGEYDCSGTITLKERNALYGQNKTNTVLNYTGSSTFITSEDVGTCTHISIHDLTINGTEKTGKGIYLMRTTKTGDTWHRLNNLYVGHFEIGIHLHKAMNEIMLNDIVANSNKTGIKVENVDDFYMDNIVTAVNDFCGILLANSTEARISNVKSWYNGNLGIDVNDKVNIAISACTGIMMTNIGCQESYHSNIRIGYSKDISIDNCYLSRPNLDHTSAEFQILFESNNNVKIECNTANTKVSGDYFNKLIEFRNKSYNCDINIKCENDYPDSLKEVINDSSKGQALELCNHIEIKGRNLRFNNKMNYALNGNLSNTETTDMIQGSIDRVSWESGLLRITSGESAGGATFKTCVLPVIGNYTAFIKFKKVSGSGRVVLDYTCYADISADDPAGTEYCISKLYTNANTSAKNNLFVNVPANTVIDIMEIGYVIGESAELELPLSYKAEIPLSTQSEQI